MADDGKPEGVVRGVLDQAREVPARSAVEEVHSTIAGAKPAPVTGPARQRLKVIDGKRGDGDAGGGASDLAPVEYSEDGLAQGFVDKHHEDLRHLGPTDEWSVWDGRRHLFDDATKIVRRLCRMHLRKESAAVESLRDARQISGQRCLSNVLKLAATDARIAAHLEDFDADPAVINTTAGLYDQRTGELRAAERADMVSQLTAVGPIGAAPTWRRCILEWAGGDRELARFLRVMAGYAATGSTSEQVLFFLYGAGANGKSLFLKMITEALGDYATNAAPDLFVVSRGERHPTDLAALRGKRLVVASEVAEGRAWDETLLKSIVGGDTQRARFVRQDSFEYTPRCKLVISGNHRPQIRNVDKAMRRRMIVVPFAAQFATPDRELPEKLRAELPGILRWVLGGALIWHKRGLILPAAVQLATNDYIDAEDAIGRWMVECCHLDPNKTAFTRAMFQSWAAWANEHGEFVGSEKRFSEALRNRGFKPWRDGRAGRGFIGIALGFKEPQAPAQQELGLAAGAAAGVGADSDVAAEGAGDGGSIERADDGAAARGGWGADSDEADPFDFREDDE